MNDIFNEIADLLMYSGPSIDQVTQKANEDGGKVKVLKQNGLSIVVVESILPYNLTAIDSYTYNADEELIKHVVKLKNKEKVIFDKFKEINSLLNIAKKQAQVC